MGKARDLTNQKFGRLTAIYLSHLDSKRRKHWYCQCDCGNKHIVQQTDLTLGKTRSCGCFNQECKSKRMFRHGHSNWKRQASSTYICWQNMKERCYDPTQNQFKDYGGRGIKVDSRWLDATCGFLNFLADMGEKPGKDYSIERINVNGNYEPSNCKWILKTEQARNKRDTVRIEFCGANLRVSEWAELFGVSYLKIYNASIRKKRPLDNFYNRVGGLALE